MVRGRHWAFLYVFTYCLDDDDNGGEFDGEQGWGVEGGEEEEEDIIVIRDEVWLSG